jgi:hypothetical protein
MVSFSIKRLPYHCSNSKQAIPNSENKKRGRRNGEGGAASAGSSFGGGLQYQGQDTTSIFYAQLR